MTESRFKANTEFERAAKSLSISMYPRDFELVEQLAQFLGCSKSEAIRTAIRSMTAQLGVIKH